jgi:hypothetical protein
MDKINEFLKNNYTYHECGGQRYPDVTKRVECKDGYSVSVQANNYTYCTPRFDEAWPYETVELGYPNTEDELISEYAEDPDIPTDTVYGYVPIDLVNKLIEKHGGIIN